MKATQNAIIATQSTIEIHVTGQEIIYIGKLHYNTLLQAIQDSRKLRQQNSPLRTIHPIYKLDQTEITGL